MTSATFVDVVTMTEASETPSVMIDPCLDAFAVGRKTSLEEMLLPGYNTGDDRLISELKPAAALIRQFVRQTTHNEKTRELISFFRQNGYVSEDNVVDPAGIQAAKEITTKYWAKDERGNDVLKETSLLNAGLRYSAMAIIDRADGLYLNPNVRFCSDLEMQVESGKEDLSVYSFYAPTPVAEGSLLCCTDDSNTTKQSTKLRVALPDGFHLLEGWLKANGRAKALNKKKFDREEV